MTESERKPNRDDINVKAELARLRTLWLFYLLSPLIYLIVALVIDYYIYKPNNRSFVVLSDSTYRLLLLASGALGLAAEILILRFKPWFEKRILNALQDPALFRKRLTMRTFILAGICDLVALLGLLLFLVRGDIRAVFCFGLLALIYYAQVYPSAPRSPLSRG
jgi:hypothetical protein